MQDPEILFAAEAALRRYVQAELERLAQELGLRTRVLLVDDEIDGTRLLQMFLERRGHPTRVAFDLPEAARALREFGPDVCVLDLELPSGDGCALADIATECSPRPKMVVLTGHCSAEHRSRAMAAGVDGYLLKPTAMRELLAAIEGP